MSQYYFVGSGIASLAGAVYLIHDGHVMGADIVIFEESSQFGGALDAHGNDASGYFMSGSRMFEEHYNATFDLLSMIPSVDDPTISAKEETVRAAAKDPWHANTRLVNRDGEVVPSHSMGFTERDRVDLLALIARPEMTLDGKRVTDCFAETFFQSNFWFEWCSLFAFEPWHSAIEFRRYLRRFIHHFSTVDTQEGVFRTKYNQYDSIAVPIVRWLRGQGVQFRMKTRVTDLRFAPGAGTTTVDRISLQVDGAASEITVEPNDKLFVTLGSMTADKKFGSMTTPATLDTSDGSGAWKLWETIADGRPEFGNPKNFDGCTSESSWESFTVTTTDPLFFELMAKFSKNEPGKGGLITFKDSSWLMTLSVFAQPFFVGQSEGTYVWWGYGLFHEKQGDYMKKTMAECTGSEILEEVIGQLHFEEHKAAIMATSTVIPCMMPYITSQFMVRKASDRPLVVPEGSVNLAFLGQYVELPNDVVFTVEYSVRSAQIAVDTLLNLESRPSPFYKGLYDPKVVLQALETMHR